MSSKTLVIGFFAFLLIFAGALYYAQVYAYYDSDQLDTFVIETDAGEVTLLNAERLISTSSPIKSRICYEGSIDLDKFELAGDPKPLNAPFWFECFDAESISISLELQEMEARIIQYNKPWGFDQYAAETQNKGYIWRQINECGEAKFNNKPLPKNCPEEA